MKKVVALGVFEAIINIAAIFSGKKDIFERGGDYFPLQILIKQGWAGPLSDHITALNAPNAFLRVR